MKNGPNLARVATLIGDRARADMLTALMAGNALTATELATEASITKQTASAHLSKLLDAKLIAVAEQGRHRYFRLAAEDVAQLLESLMGVAQRTGATRVRTGPREPALRRARVCYDHLAGEVGVALFDVLIERKLVQPSERRGDPARVIQLTASGRAFFTEFGIDVTAQSGSRRPLCRSCLDWSVRRNHLAGRVGAAVLTQLYERNWAKRVAGTRVVRFSRTGEEKFRQAFGLASLS